MPAFALALAAEATKLCGLPSVVLTVAGSILAGAGFGAAFAGSTDEQIDVVWIVQQSIVFVQVGAILLGVVAVASEYAGRQIATSLTAVPRRATMLAAKATVVLAATALTALTTVLAIVGGAVLVRAIRGQDVAWPESSWPLAGAVCYLVLMGLLAFGLTVVLRSLLAPLVGLMAVVLLVSPVVAARTEHARWLPDRAGRLLYAPGSDDVLTAGSGAVVLVAWVVLVGAIAWLGFLRRDA